MRVGLIGTGAMGDPMGRRLLAAGHDLCVYNRTAARADGLVAAGARRAKDAADAGRDRELLLTVLTDGHAVADVMAAGAARALPSGAVLVDASTTGPDFVRRLRLLVPAGVGVVDAPVLGSRAEAAAGRLTILAGGDTRDVRRALPVLEELGEVRHLGPAGTGAAAKLIANFALLGTLSVLAETVALGRALGLPDMSTLATLAATPLAEQAAKRRNALAGEPGPARFGLALATKDALLVREAAANAGLHAPVAAAVHERLAAAEAAGLGAADYTAMLGCLTPERRSD